MSNMEKVIKDLDECMTASCRGYRPRLSCPYNDEEWDIMRDALTLLKEQEKEIKALRLLVEWAEECDFGFDNFPDEYERYKDEIKGMKYIDGMVHVAKRTLEDHWAFEEGR